MTKASSDHIELDNFWPYQIIVLADLISRYTLDVVRSEADINQSQWRVLAAVAGKPGRTSADVTAVTPMDKTIVSRAVSSLIEVGFIEKTPDKEDRRRLSLKPTAQGLACYKKIAARLNEALINDLETSHSPKDFVDTLKIFSDKMKHMSA